MVPTRVSRPCVAAILTAALLGAADAVRKVAVPPFPSVVVPADSWGAEGLAAADLDGDGRDDLAVTLSATDEVLVIRGAGPVPPAAGPRLPVGDWPVTVRAADLDGDGFPDLATLNFRSADISIVMGRVDGGFDSERRVAFLQGAGGDIDPAATRALDVADFDRDGVLDLAAVNGDDISLLRGLGDGTFVSWGRVPAGDRPFSIVAGDFDADGRIDLATTNIASDDVVFLLGRGDGTFDPLPGVAAGVMPGGLAAADLDGNGTLDLVTANRRANDPLDSSAGDISVLLGSGGGRFMPAVRYRAGKATTQVALGDFNHDGRTDIAAANSVSGDVSVFQGAGDGTFGAEYRVRVGPSPADLLAHDFDGGGDLDLVSTTTAAGVSFVAGLGDGTFGPQMAEDTIVRPNAVAAADLDRDDRLDLIIVGSPRDAPESADVALFPGRGGGGFGQPIHLDVTEFSPGPTDAVVTDFNGDGVPDLAVTDGVRSVAVVAGRGGWTFEPASWVETGFHPQALGAADFDADGRQDLAVAHASTDGVAILLGRGDGGFDPGVRWPVGERYVDLVVADFNSDGAVDAAAVGTDYEEGIGYRDVARIWGGLGDGRFREPVVREVADSPVGLAVADLDGNGLPDLLVSSRVELTLLVNRGDLDFATGARHPGPWFMTGILAADFTRDGVVDAAVLNTMREVVSIFPGVGDGTLGSELRSIAGRIPIAMAAGDFDGDGAPDLVTADRGLSDPWFGSLPDLYLMPNRTPAPNRAPTAVAMAPEVAECVSWNGALVRLDGTASHDPDAGPGDAGDLAGFEWYEGFGTTSEALLGSGAVIDVMLGLGAHAITLLVTDRAGVSDTATITVIVEDTLAPAFERLHVDPAVIEIPDHGMVDVAVTAAAADRCGPVEVVLVSVTSSEADDAPGAGDGHTTGDVGGVDAGRADFRFRVRAERSATGVGRTYAVVYRAVDAVGHATDAVTSVAVPHDARSPRAPAAAASRLH